jgi:hypothetical protein
MHTGNTTLLGLALPVEGELDGTWGDVVNDSITSLVDSAIAGTTTLTTDADVTLTTTALAANQARQAIIRWAPASGTATRNINAPNLSKPYIVINATGGTQSIVLRGATGPTTGITIVAGESCLAVWNGSDFIKISSTSAGDVTLNGVQTLTNKRIDPRNVVAASASTLTPDVSVGDIYAYTALAAALTINAPIGSPTDGDKLIFRLLDNGTARALTWNATYTVIGVTLPTTTVASKTTYVGCIYNANNTRWDVTAVTTQA